MKKILCLMVVLSLLIVGCGEEKKEVNPTPVSKKVSSSTKAQKDEKMKVLMKGMAECDWTPDSALKFLNSIYDGRVTMIRDSNEGSVIHKFHNKSIRTMMDLELRRQVPNIRSLEGKLPEALYFIGESEQPHFILKYKSIMFTTGLLPGHVGEDNRIQSVHIGTFLKYEGHMEKILLSKEAQLGFDRTLVSVWDKL